MRDDDCPFGEYRWEKVTWFRGSLSLLIALPGPVPKSGPDLTPLSGLKLSLLRWPVDNPDSLTRNGRSAPGLDSYLQTFIRYRLFLFLRHLGFYACLTLLCMLCMTLQFMEEDSSGEGVSQMVWKLKEDCYNKKIWISCLHSNLNICISPIPANKLFINNICEVENINTLSSTMLRHLDWTANRFQHHLDVFASILPLGCYHVARRKWSTLTLYYYHFFKHYFISQIL